MTKPSTKISANYFLLIYFSLSIQFLHAQPCGSGGVILTDQADVDNFTIDYPGCTHILGNLTIDENFLGANGNITDLSPLQVLTIIDGSLSVRNNDNITTLQGLHNISTVGLSTGVINNLQLTDLTGLTNLESTSGLVVDGLETLDGINSLQTIFVEEGFARALGLQGSQLSDISALGNVDIEVARLLMVETSLSDLEMLSDAVFRNGITIVDNLILSFCSIPSICDIVLDPDAFNIVDNNATNCNSEDEIIGLCFSVPVEWVSFDTYFRDDKVELEFSTIQDVSHSYYEVEHSDGVHDFSTLKYIEGNGEEDYYSFSLTHSDYVAGNNYYRIKQVDRNGDISYSKISHLDIPNQYLSFYPNPVSDYITVSSPSSSRYNIRNNLGTDIKSGIISKRESKIDIGELPPGLYYFSVAYQEKYEIIIKL